MLYSYCIPVDDGAAPNPFWGTCTLAICKPVIRRTAVAGDWIVGTGSMKYGFQNKLIYAMRIDSVMPFSEYDRYCKIKLPEKIPDWKSKDLRRRVGDCIYDFSSGKPVLRKSVHEGEEIIKRDFRGANALLSTHYCYFGSQPIQIKESLLPIVKQGQGHKSKANDPYLGEFVEWIEEFLKNKNEHQIQPYGFNVWEDEECSLSCSTRHIEEDDADERFGDC
jgi:hypothetical protein